MNGTSQHLRGALAAVDEAHPEARLIALVKSLSPEQLAILQSIENKPEAKPQPAVAEVLPVIRERRQTPRRRVFLGAKIIFNGRTIVIDCHVRDISEAGCRVRSQSTAGIPFRFSLLFTAANRCRECETRWRDDSHIGIRFLN